MWIGLLAVLLSAPCHAERIGGYYKSDGTYVEPHERSAPNAYRWDNKRYTPSQPAYNPSYYQPMRNYGGGWYHPNQQRFNDNNPHNDYAPSYSPPAYKSNLEFKAPDFVKPAQYNVDMNRAIDSMQRAAENEAEIRRMDKVIEFQKNLLYERKLMILNAFDEVLNRYPRADETNFFLRFLHENNDLKGDNLGEHDIKEILRMGKREGSIK